MAAPEPADAASARFALDLRAGDTFWCTADPGWVTGKPDPVAGEIFKAFVTLKAGYKPSGELLADLVAFGRQRLGAVAPREIQFARAFR